MFWCRRVFAALLIKYRAALKVRMYPALWIGWIGEIHSYHHVGDVDMDVPSWCLVCCHQRRYLW